MEIVKNQITKYHICYSVDASECVRYAASELLKYLLKSTSCPFPIFADKCKKRGPEILVGLTNRYSDLGELVNYSKEAFLIKNIKEDIVILGNSDRAVLYGVYYFLETYFGFRCFTSTCEKIDSIDELSLDDIYILKDFPFEYREAYFQDAFDGSFASKNMLNGTLSRIADYQGGKVKWFNFHHSFFQLINPDEYFDSHPEYFSLIDGERRKEHTELCLSNPEVREICYNKVRNWIINNPEYDVFSVSQEEWMGHFVKLACECNQCKKIDMENESQSGSVITFVNYILERLEKEFPDKLIHTFAYQYSRKTPTKVKPHKNLIVRLCNIECSWDMSIEEKAKDKSTEAYKFLNDLINWGKITNRLYIWDYCVNFHNYLLPFPNLRTMVKNVNLYKKSNVKGVLMQGNFSYGGKGYLDELKAYLIARLLRGDNVVLEDLVKEFCDNYYGKASKYIYDYIFLWEDSVKGTNMWLYDDADSKLFNDDNIKQATILMNKAVNAVSGVYLERVNVLELGLEYLKLVRLPMNYPHRNELIDDFAKRAKKAGITELFERTSFDLSIQMMKQSQYAKDRKNWYSLYYIMR